MSNVWRVEQFMPGFSVVEGRSKLVSVSHMANHGCIDDRRVKSLIKTKAMTHGVKTMGATYGTGYVAAVANRYNRYDEGYFRDFAEKVREVGRATPAVHDVDHMHCKHAQVVASGGFGDNIAVDIKKPTDILASLESVNGRQVHLAGDHNPESVLRLNFNEGTTLLQDGNGYTMDFWWAWGIMAIEPNALYDNLSKTLVALGVSKIEVYG